ncbi:MAG: glycoside hydrolase family 32 protein [Oscillospiraceae bacterium]|nr:glycoside hydrolase family 32 protein [Oscillospiraceae bacterium]
MPSELLSKARRYEEQARREAESELPAFHLTGGSGWINDPNGFATYRGEVHLFFQYYPYDVCWGPMHWGHAKTKDFIHWDFLPAALAPDREYDKDGCFSGGAVEMPDGRHLLLYTGVRKDVKENGGIREVQTQCAAIGDGIDYEKISENPVLTAADLPEGGSEHDFRDPKIWMEDGIYYVIAGNRNKFGRGEVLLFASRDALHWQRLGTVLSCTEEGGPMWECPDLFVLDGKAVLLHSALEMRPSAPEFHPGNGTACHIGQLDRETWHFTEEALQTVDYGLDFYAPQTVLAPDGRRIMIAWMQNWDSSRFTPKNLHFFGQMTFPRELHIRYNRLCQWPVREIEDCRCNSVFLKDLPVTEEKSFPEIHGRVLDLFLHVRPGKGEQYRRFTVKLACGGGFYTEISCFPEQSIIKIDRTQSGFPHDIAHVREFPVTFRDSEISLRLLLDRYSFELFVNGGEQAASSTLYTPLTAEELLFSADGEVLLTAEKYDLIITESGDVP